MSKNIFTKFANGIQVGNVVSNWVIESNEVQPRDSVPANGNGALNSYLPNIKKHQKERASHMKIFFGILLKGKFYLSHTLSPMRTGASIILCATLSPRPNIVLGAGKGPKYRYWLTDGLNEWMNEYNMDFKKLLTLLGCINRGRKCRTRDVCVLLYSVLVRQLVHSISIEISFAHWPLRSSVESNWGGEWNNTLRGREGTDTFVTFVCQLLSETYLI